uniref:Uncharacterized protein n=1 Tax=Parascaris equorum TaxID=6256 RepID=A0A914RQN3_PAREQ
MEKCTIDMKYQWNCGGVEIQSEYERKTVVTFRNMDTERNGDLWRFYDNSGRLSINLCSSILEWKDVPDDIKRRLNAGEFSKKTSN